MVDSPIRRLTTRRIDDRSVGFLVAGASSVAARWMIEAIWRQPPAAGSHDVAGAYVAALFSHNARLAQRFADQHGIVLAGGGALLNGLPKYTYRAPALRSRISPFPAATNSY